MSKANYHKKINKEIDQHCEKYISHLTIDFDRQNDGWYWRYMSIDTRNKDLYFQSPIETLVHFAAWIAEERLFEDTE